MYSADFSASGFSVVANNALDYAVGSQAAGAGYVGANIQAIGKTLHYDVKELTNTLVEKSNQLMQVNQEGFTKLGSTLGSGFKTLKILSGAQLAVSAAGFALVATQLHGLRGELRGLRADLVAQGEVLIQLQHVANQRLDQIIDVAGQSLETQERMLDALLTSRTVEARQLVRQGWDNLKHGYDDEALRRFEQSLEHDNTIHFAHTLLARIYYKRMDKLRAEDHYVRATKFAEAAGPDALALARIEYASFLESEGRVEDCIDHLRAALEHDDHAGRRFHLAELLVRVARVPPGLIELRRAIEANDKLYVAAMLSHDFVALGPALTQLLVDLDETRRRPGIDHMEALCKSIDCLDAVGRLESPRAGKVQASADAFRQEAVRILRDHLKAAFADLPSTSAQASDLRGRATQEADAAPAKVAEALQRWVAAWEWEIDRFAALSPKVTPAPKARIVGGWSLLILSVLFLGVSVVAFGLFALPAAYLIVSGGQAKRATLAANHAAMTACSNGAAAVATLMSSVTTSAQVRVGQWLERLDDRSFRDLHATLVNRDFSFDPSASASTLKSAPGSLPMAEWQVAANQPFGAVPTLAARSASW